MDVTPTASVLNSTGEVFKLYGEHFGAGTQPLTVAVEVDPNRSPSIRGLCTSQGPRRQPHPIRWMYRRPRPGPKDSLRIAVVNATFGAQTLEIKLNGLQAPAAAAESGG